MINVNIATCQNLIIIVRANEKPKYYEIIFTLNVIIRMATIAPNKYHIAIKIDGMKMNGLLRNVNAIIYILSGSQNVNIN